jgi:mannosyltransferase OCH1-like enzyme
VGDYARRLIAACVGSLMGIPSTRYADVERALRSNLNLRYVASVVALRLLRKIGGLANRIGAVARRLRGGARNVDDRCVAAKYSTIECQLHRDEDESLRIPIISTSPARRPFPRHMFQTWKTKTQVPENYARWSDSVRIRNANFEHFLWDDFDNRKFIADYYPWFLAIYDAYPREIYRADAVRYFFMYQFGGVYLDMDTECLEPLAPLFDSSADVWLGRMGDDADFPHSIPNAIMASRPLQEFWLLAMHFLLENATTTVGSHAQVLAGPEAMTGSILLKKTYDTYVSGKRDAVREMIRRVVVRFPANLRPAPTLSTIELLEPNCWYPMNWANVIHDQLLWEIRNNTIRLGGRAKRWLFPSSYLVSYWGHSWKEAP